MEKIARLNKAGMLLAGDHGRQMNVPCPLRLKPCSPFAGQFRVVDFVLSNCLHSQISQVATLVDYQRAAIERLITVLNQEV